MTNITKQDMIDFILSMPDERKVDFNKSRARNKRECGCVMAQYAYEKLNHRGYVECGTTVILDKKAKTIGDLDFELKEIIKNGYFNRSETFGELKTNLQ